MQEIIFDNVVCLRKLGEGMLGSTYLARYKGKYYARKIQHILEKDITKNYSSDLWRELELYKYISKLPKNDRLFFTHLYGYNIFNNCDHIQMRRSKINLDEKFAQKLKRLDESDYCVEYLLDYNGKLTLSKYLTRHFPSRNTTYMMMLQICKIIYVLYEGGYSHNDLHPGNIMMKKTDKKYFDFRGRKVPYYGVQLIAIDFGEVLHKKFGIKYTGHLKQFLTDPEQFMFHEMFYSCINVMNYVSRMIKDCDDAKKKIPWEIKGRWDKGMVSIIHKHPDFISLSKDKYLRIFPHVTKDLDRFISNMNIPSDNRSLPRNNIHRYDISHVMSRLMLEFQIFFPEKYSKYMGWPSWYDPRSPTHEIQQILAFKDYTSLIDTLLAFIDE